MSRVIDLTGQQFGNQLVLRRAENIVHPSGKSEVAWVVQCKCGSPERTIAAYELQRGHSKSCGCRNSGRPIIDFAAVVDYLFSQYQYNATSRGYSWEIDRQRFEALIAGTCVYCGDSPSTASHRKNGFLYNGIDRVDNTLGYIAGNVVSCCKYCNRAKGTMKVEDFIAYLSKASKYQESHRST